MSIRASIPGVRQKDKFIVEDEVSKGTIWWTSEQLKNDNKPMTQQAWNEAKALCLKQLSGKKLYVVDGFCGASEATRLRVRFIMEVAWQGAFCQKHVYPSE